MEAARWWPLLIPDLPLSDRGKLASFADVRVVLGS